MNILNIYHIVLNTFFGSCIGAFLGFIFPIFGCGYIGACIGGLCAMIFRMSETMNFLIILGILIGVLFGIFLEFFWITLFFFIFGIFFGFCLGIVFGHHRLKDMINNMEIIDESKKYTDLSIIDYSYTFLKKIIKFIYRL